MGILCNNCKCKEECEYYHETIKPIIDATKWWMDDSLHKRVRDVLMNSMDEDECEYYEPKGCEF